MYGQCTFLIGQSFVSLNPINLLPCHRLPLPLATHRLSSGLRLSPIGLAQGYACHLPLATSSMKNIIFDLGAVIIDINYNFTAEAFKKIGVTNFDEIYSKKKQDHFFDDFETGHLTNDQFRSEIRKHITHKISDEQIDDAWNAMLINIPVSRMKWLQSLRPQYRIFYLAIPTVFM
ncbi:MAG: hypothetical protein IPP34_09545 [Bacteroidetes bacterium]|nr:hypothetical protein [Bacteroidota bacterium]